MEFEHKGWVWRRTFLCPFHFFSISHSFVSLLTHPFLHIPPYNSLQPISMPLYIFCACKQLDASRTLWSVKSHSTVAREVSLKSWIVCNYVYSSVLLLHEQPDTWVWRLLHKAGEHQYLDTDRSDDEIWVQWLDWSHWELNERPSVHLPQHQRHLHPIGSHTLLL